MTDPARIVFDPDTRRVGIRTGKVELGQHVHDAYVQIVARDLSVVATHIHVCPVSTVDSPDDGLTVGSMSVQITGAALSVHAVLLAGTLRTRAAQRMNVPEAEVTLDPGAMTYSSGAAQCDLFDLAAGLDAALIAPVAAVTSLIDSAITGQRVFLPDMTLPNMAHGRALRGRSVAAVKALLPAQCELFEDHGFAAVIAPTDADLLAFWDRLPQTEAPGTTAFDGPAPDWIKSCAVTTTTAGTSALQATSVMASRPFLLHGSIAPSCAIALFDGGRMTVWTSSQGIFPLRDQIARAVGLSSDAVDLRHVPSAGSYGHNGADDAAADAALIAMHRPGHPIRVAWPREDEARHGPVGAPMVVEASATLDGEKITGWHQGIWSGPHGQRPGGGGNINILAAMERDPSLRPNRFADLPAQIGGGASRNGAPFYAIPDVAVTTHIVQDLPVRTSSLRGLGAQMNTVAIEALMDRLAAQAGQCPLDFRARHLDDPRALAVLEKLRVPLAMDLAEDEAIGIAIGRYKNKAAYVGVAARIKLEDTPRVRDLWAVVDAGRVVSHTGALNQIEGGMIQAASWTLCEGTALRDGQIEASGWADYPTLAWDQIPEMHVEIIASDAPPLGVGECMVGPTSAAIVNAVSACLGQTVAHLPLDRDMLIKVLSS